MVLSDLCIVLSPRRAKKRCIKGKKSMVCVSSMDILFTPQGEKDIQKIKQPAAAG
jgi:hypothetical protein